MRRCSHLEFNVLAVRGKEQIRSGPCCSLFHTVIVLKDWHEENDDPTLCAFLGFRNGMTHWRVGF